MAKNPKYPESELADEDKKILDRVILKYAVKFQELKQKYPDPRVYVKNVIIKNLSSDAVFGTLLTTAYAKNDPIESIFDPGRLNQRLENDTRHVIERDRNSSMGYQETSHTSDNFLYPRDLRERLLKKVEDLNLFVHLKGKKAIIQHRRKIKNLAKKIDDRGGYPSAYVISDDVVKIRKIIEKSGAANYFLEKMNRCGLGFALTKYLILALFHAANLDKRILPRILVPGWKITNVNIAEGNTNWDAIFQTLQSFAGDDLEESAKNAAEILTRNPDYHDLMIFLSVLIKLLNF